MGRTVGLPAPAVLTGDVEGQGWTPHFAPDAPAVTRPSALTETRPGTGELGRGVNQRCNGNGPWGNPHGCGRAALWWRRGPSASRYSGCVARALQMRAEGPGLWCQGHSVCVCVCDGGGMPC